VPLAFLPRWSWLSRRLFGPVVVLAAVLALAGGCQVKVDVHTKVNRNGSGSVVVAVGLDDGAVAKVGDLNSQLRVDDLRAAGWEISGPDREADGFTWIRATKPFADEAAAGRVMDEVNGADGAFRGWQVQRSSSLLSTSYRVDGTVDLTRGVETFGDEQLRQLLGGDPLADAVKRLEQEEGRPIAEQVDVTVTVETPGATRTYTPSLADTEPTAVKASSSTTNWGGLLVVTVVLAAVAALASAVLLRRRHVRRLRDRRGRSPVRGR
jgi:hypothetical protein